MSEEAKLIAKDSITPCYGNNCGIENLPFLFDDNMNMDSFPQIDGDNRESSTKNKKTKN